MSGLVDAQRRLENMAQLPMPPEPLLGLILQASARMAEAVEPGHNSSWDYAIAPDGRHYFSVCAESLNTEYLRLYEYLPDENRCQRILGLEEVAVTYPRAIRASKIHSSLSALPDGRLIFASHTTAAAPGHPRWLPFAYYSHPWEGYPGSNLLIWDPRTGRAEDLGIPVPRESIYGGLYERRTDSFYFMGYHRGHAYRFDLKTRRVTDFGQATEFGTWRLMPGLDGDLYGTTASGRLLRINIAAQRVEDVPGNFPFDRRLIEGGTNNKVMHYANHPDGRLYFTALSCTSFLRYDYRTRKVEQLRSLVPAEIADLGLKARCMGLAADGQGALWYLCEVLGLGSYLVRWDPNGERPPENMGLAGCGERVTRASFGCFIQDDRIFWNDTNRAEGAQVAVMQADLADLRIRAGEAREPSRDPLTYAVLRGGQARYRALTGRSLLEDVMPELAAQEEIAAHRRSDEYVRTMPLGYDEAMRVRFYGDSAINATHLPSVSRWVAKLWQEERLYGARVRSVQFEGADVLAVVEMDGAYQLLTLRDGAVIARERSDWREPDVAALVAKYRDVQLPWQAERRHLAYASAECALADGYALVGTRDAMLALIGPDGGIFSLGAICSSGAVHALAASPDGQRAIGVAGDPDDLGTLFQFDRRRGLVIHGRLFFHDASSPGLIGASSEPDSVAWSADGRYVSVGVRDRLACVYCFELPPESV